MRLRERAPHALTDVDGNSTANFRVVMIGNHILTAADFVFSVLIGLGRRVDAEAADPTNVPHMFLRRPRSIAGFERSRMRDPTTDNPLERRQARAPLVARQDAGRFAAMPPYVVSERKPGLYNQ
jgi:hypothetical protein